MFSFLVQNGNGGSLHPAGPGVPGNPHYQLPKPGLWNPLHSDSWGLERKNVAAPERQVRRLPLPLRLVVVRLVPPTNSSQWEGHVVGKGMAWLL